jgi:hypothetical protein
VNLAPHVGDAILQTLIIAQMVLTEPSVVLSDEKGRLSGLSSSPNRVFMKSSTKVYLGERGRGGLLGCALLAMS